MLERKIISTEDGSSTLFIPEWNESYHSRHGAIQEAYHVFIQNGLDNFSDQKEVSILEIGLGTGLNALISCTEAIFNKQHLRYTGIEKYPLRNEEYAQLNYPESLFAHKPDLPISEEEMSDFYTKMMQADWEVENQIHPLFQLEKIQADFLSYSYPKERFDLVYFDAFGARVQPELWTEELFVKLHQALKTNGLLTTYSAKGSVRRALKEVGFEVQKRPGPPGKREMLIARK